VKIEFITLTETGKQTKRFEPFPTGQLLWSILAALTPMDIELGIQDEHYRPISLNTDADLIAITVATPVALRAYQLGKQFSQLGKKVVYGGPHITQIQKYPEYKDEPFLFGNAFAIFVGDAEETWPIFINDLAGGRETKKVYTGGPFGFNIPITPRRGLYPRYGLQRLLPEIVTIESSRGCPGRCTFCCANGQYQTKPIEQLFSELRALKSRYHNFIDSNLGGNERHFLQLLELMKQQKCGWAGSAFLPALRGKGRLLKEAHCGVVYIGIESVNSESAAEIHKPFSNVVLAKEIIQELHDNDIAVIGSFIFGFDHDDISVFDKTINFAVEARLDDASFHMLMPYPGTPIFDKLRGENRLKYINFPQDWAKYGRDEVAFIPLRMSPDELRDGYHSVINQFYSPGAIRHRLGNRILSQKGLGILFSNFIKCIKTRHITH